MASLKSQILGHQSIITQLEKTYASGRLPHAMIFYGPTGIGKNLTALALAQFLVCESDIKPCGDCGSCVRVQKKQSEKLKIASPDGQFIKVDQIRDILDFLSLSHQGENRIVIIDQAHLLNPQAANALLKVLEEPSENVYFILIGPDISQFMSTIRSRAQSVRFSPLSLQDLQKLRPGLEDWIYKASRGQMDQLALFSTEEGLAYRNYSLQMVEQFFFNPDFLKDETWKKTLKDREVSAATVRFWLTFFRDVLLLQMTAEEKVLNSDQKNLLSKFKKFDSRVLQNFVTDLFQLEKDIKSNADTSLLFESLWVKYGQTNQ